LDRLAGVLSAQRQFVADAAHELRTPLTALGGMVEMLQIGADRGDPATFRRMLNTMEREIGRLTRLVSDLLTLSRLEAQQTLKLAPVELAPLLGEIASQARLLASGQNVRLSLEAKPIVLGDADRLRQVLINLVDNALAFTPAGGEVHLSLAETAGSARLVVADNGTGIAPEVLPRVMDRFVRGDPSRARATGGSGLGLSIARGIVEALGGSIMLNSRPGQGTTVTITLPRLSAGATSANLQLSRTEDSASTAILEEHSAVSHQRGTRSGRAKTRS
jgi:two-component system OmpR family sensor kinase